MSEYDVAGGLAAIAAAIEMAVFLFRVEVVYNNQTFDLRALSLSLLAAAIAVVCLG